MGIEVQVFNMEQAAKEEQLESLKTDVWTKLPQLKVEELEQVCTALELDVTPESQGKKSAVYSVVALHLMSNTINTMEIDMALEMFGNVQSALDGIMALRVVKTEVETTATVDTGAEAGGSGGNLDATPVIPTISSSSQTVAPSLNGSNTPVTGTSTLNNTQNTTQQNTHTNTTTTNSVRSRMSQQFANLAALAAPPMVQYAIPRIAPLREFKIGGTVGKGFKDSLSYATVLSRIKQGKQQGYTASEVMAAVAKAIRSTELQDIVENGDLDEDTFLEVLKVHYLEKSANSVYNEMCAAKQKAGEDEVTFLIRMCGLRKRVEKLSLEEGRPMDNTLLKDSFFSSLATGFRQGAVRLELQSTLRNQTLSDRELIHEVGLVVAKEQQHLLKMEGAKEDVSVEEVEVLNGGNRYGGGGRPSGGSKVPESRPVDQEILGAIADLKVDVNRKLTKVQDDVQDLKSRVAQCEQRWVERATGGPILPVKAKKPFKFLKCTNCEEGGKKCFHCTTCGELGHKRGDCPRKNEEALDG